MATKQLKSPEQEDKLALAQNRFLDDTACNIAQTCNNIKDADFDIESAKRKGLSQLTALEVEGSLQEMLASQMLSIHKYQQLAMVMSHGLPAGEYQQYYTNTGIKLANTFVQQANLLAKLQGRIGQKIIVERVNISQGGQAVIGTVNAQER